MNKIKRIEKYLFDFFSNGRFELLDVIYRSTHRDRHYPGGIYRFKHGTILMDLLIHMHSLVEEKLYAEKLIPHNFATPEVLLASLDAFKKHLNDHQEILDMNREDDNVHSIIDSIQELKNEYIQMIDYVKKIYDQEDTVIPYQELRYKLIVHNIPDFITILKSILASVSYAISKAKEGYHHSNVHLILKLLGFDILAEETTNIGRIDATIRFSDKIYIVEFKFNESKDLSKEALQQIKDNEYAQKFILEKKEIYGIGISFSEEKKNINGFEFDKLND